jgi:phosphohistidine swiveling domain-containing protein
MVLSMTKAFNTDVWFNWQQPASPYLLGPTIDACGAPFRDKFGFPFFTSVIYYRTIDSERGYQASWLLRLDEGRACGRLLHDLLAVPSFRPWFDKQVDTTFRNVVDGAKELHIGRLDALSDAELLEHFASYYSQFVAFYTVGAVTEPIQWHAEAIFREYSASTRKLDRKLAPEGWSDERIESALFSLTSEPYTRTIERDLLNVARTIEDALPRVSGLHGLSDDELAVSLLEDEEVRQAAVSHVTQYSWKANNYRAVSVLSPRDVVAEVLRMGEGRTAPVNTIGRRLSESTQRMREAASERAEILIRAPEAVRIAIQLGEQYGSSLADRRKAVMLQALQGLDLLGRELASRASADYDDFLLLTPQEIATFASRSDTYAPRWSARRETLVLVSAPAPLENAEMVAHLELSKDTKSAPRKMDVSVAEGETGVNLLAELDLRMAIFDDHEAQRVAHGDVVTGPGGSTLIEAVCRVVTDPRKDELQPGEILIATSTTPDFMPAIHRARALLVDQGGVLSHAALTSRELNKPCIIGTSIATALFRTGDVIRMDFETGTATRLDDLEVPS